MTSHLDHAISSSVHAACRDIHDVLEHAKRAVSEQIRVYPTPIARCDAQFNHLCAQRARIAEQLEQARALLEGGTDAGRRRFVAAFARAMPYGEEPDEERLRADLRTWAARLDARHGPGGTAALRDR